MKGCLGIIVAIVVLIWAFSDSETFFIALGILAVFTVLMFFIELSGKKTPAAKQAEWTSLTPAGSFSGEIYDDDDRFSDVLKSDYDRIYDHIYEIRSEDDEFMAIFEEKISDFKFENKCDFDAWYENEVEPNKIYTDKYLVRRMRKRMEEEDII
jgi:hypothetical protein